MGKIAVMTDSNSGLTPEEAGQMGAFLVPMPFYLNDEVFYENETISRDRFFEAQAQDVEIHTSQPVVGDLLDRWNAVLKDYDGLLYIPMSSGLSGSCASAAALAEDYDGKVVVVNNQRISVTQKQAVRDAVRLAEEGHSVEEIHRYLMDTKFDSTIYITVDTLKYLKKGGRVTAAGAAIGTVLNIKPVLTIQGEKLDAFAKARGMKAAKKRMIAAMDEELADRFSDIPAEELKLGAAYTCDEETANAWKKTLEEHFGKPCEMDPLPLSIACHTGPGAIAAGFVRVYPGE